MQTAGITCIMDGVGNSPLHTLGQLLLQLLRDNRILASSLGVGLVGGLVRLRASRMDLASVSAL